MKKHFRGPGHLLTIVALAVAAATGAVSPALAASVGTGSAAVHIAAASGKAAAPHAPCSIVPSDKTCESTDPTVAISVYYQGDTSACTFVWNVNWGDGASTTNLAQADPSDGYYLLANHTYATPGKYTITDTGQVTAGNCTATSGVHTFTLASPQSPIATIPNGTAWSGYTTDIPNARTQPTSQEYYADARWTVPHVDCSAKHHPIIGLSSSVAMWVGLGGVKLPNDPASAHLVQAGILSRCGAYHEYDDAVYQILPPDNVHIDLSSAKYPVKPGDSVEVTVERQSKYVYSMEINDTTQQWVWSKAFTASFGNVPDSADYIVEKPGPYQSDFGTVTFHMANYTTFPLGSCLNCGPEFLNKGYAWRFVGVNLLNQDVAKVGPISSPVSADPGTFSVTWKQGS